MQRARPTDRGARVTVADRQGLATPADAEHVVLDDQSGLRSQQRRLLGFAVFMVLVLALPVAVFLGHIRAEWALAFGRAKVVRAAVIGSRPSAEFARCGALTQIDVRWPAPDGTNPGNFTVCDYDVASYPVGKVISVAVTRGERSVIVGEDQGSAVFGVVLESLLLAFVLLLVMAALRQCLRLGVAVRRLKGAPWLPAEAVRLASQTVRGTTTVRILALFDSDRAPSLSAGLPQALPPPTDPFAPGQQSRRLKLRILPRKDKERLEHGTPVWVVPTGRTLWRHRRSGPYAVIRASDRKVFWASGGALPGDEA